MRLRMIPVGSVAIVLTVLIFRVDAGTKPGSAATSALTPRDAAAAVDHEILTQLQKAGISVADRCNDEDFLRRVSLDLVGQLPSPSQIADFHQDPDPDKRAKLIEKLIDSPEFGVNWARYWRDVIYLRATEQRSRLNQQEFEGWLADQWNKGTGWNETVTAMLTAGGNVEEHPETALIFAQQAVAEEVAAESCRIFLGIQLQCANCHDHPSDIWKREQFHQLAAYFPRITERRIPDQKPGFEIVSVNTERRPPDFMRENPDLFIARFDRNRDHKVSKEELTAGPAKMPRRKAVKAEMKMEMMPEPKLNAKIIDRLFEGGDTNRDGLLTAEEIKNMPVPGNMRKGSTEHHMVDLMHPNAEGKLIDPQFFVDQSKVPHGLSDDERRKAVAVAFTSPENPWFARAIVNRMWAEMLGEGFYMPIDDMGPTRTARYPEAMDVLCKAFVASGYHPKWLLRTIASTEAYQRKIQSRPVSENDLPFAAATPVPLRSDIVFSSLMHVFDLSEDEMGGRRPAPKEMKDKQDKPKAFRQNPRFLFDMLFAADPSTPKDDVTGNIPQSLMMMNSRRFRAGISAKGDTTLGKILLESKDNKTALSNLYLLVLAREPSAHEIEICMAYIAEVKSRPESFEDLMWSLLNSSEFISRR